MLKPIGWSELYPDTLKRLKYFRDNFRVNFTQEEISDYDLDTAVVYCFGIYGQGEIYNILSVVKDGIKKGETLDIIFKNFADAFKVLGEDKYNSIQPRTMINLFLEYLYSVHIKR